MIIYTISNAASAPIGAEGYFSSDPEYLIHAITSNEYLPVRTLRDVDVCNRFEPFIDTNNNKWACFYPLKKE